MVPRAGLAVLAAFLLVTLACPGGGVARADLGEARPWLGIALAQGRRGARVTGIFEGSPAASSGLDKGDEVLAVDRTATPTPEALQQAIHDAGAGAVVSLRVVGPSGSERPVRVRLDVMPSERQLARGALLGKAAPDFTLPAARGPLAPVALSALRGQVVLIDFWATWCGYCVLTMPIVEGWSERYRGSGLRVIGITDEELDAATSFTKAHGVSYTIASDPDHAAIDHYRVTGLPMMVLVDRSGVVRRVDIGAGRDELAAMEGEIRRLVSAPGGQGGAVR